MRNLKRALSLALASVMLMGMMVVGSSAASYPDVDDNNNIEAIEVLQAVGVMTGDADTGNFRPNDNVKRSEMARIMADLMDLNYDYYTGTNPFTDMDGHWAEKYVAACYTNGIIAGRTETTYDPEATVTAVEAAAMLMRALGYFQNKDTDYDGGFVVATVRQAGKIDLFNDVSTKTNDPMTRDDVAQLVLNTLKSGMVEPDNGNKIDVNLPNGGSVSIGATNYVYVTSREKYAEAIYDTKVENSASSSANLNAPIVELGEKLYQGDLVLKDWRYGGETDDFGRPASTWTYQAKDIGTYAEEAEEHLTFAEEVTPKAMYNAVGKTAAEKYTWTIKLNGELQSGFDRAQLVSNQTVDSGDFFDKCGGSKGLTGNGVLTQVYVDGTEEEVIVAITYFYAAEVYTVKDGKITLSRIEADAPSTTSDEFDNDGFEEDDIVYFTFAQNKIQSVEKADRIEGTVTKAVAATNDENGKNFNLGDDNYKYIKTMDKADALTTDNVDNNMVGYTMPLGGKDWCIYIDWAAAQYDYAYVLSAGTDSDKADNVTGKDETVWARLVFPDGTMKVVETDAEKKFDKRAENDGLDWLRNHIVSYSKNSSNVYSLSVKDTAKANDENVGGTGETQTYDKAKTEIFRNGKSKIWDANGKPWTANNNTVVIVGESGNTWNNYSFTVYTGVENIPDIDSRDATTEANTTSICVAAGKNGVAKVVYVENADVSGNGDVVFVIANQNADQTHESGSSRYYNLTAFVNGEKVSNFNVKKNSDAYNMLITNARANFGEGGKYATKTLGQQGTEAGKQTKFIVPLRVVTRDADNLVTNVKPYELNGTNKMISGTQTTKNNNGAVGLVGNGSWYVLKDARLVTYRVKNDVYETAGVGSVKDSTVDQYVGVVEDGDLIGLFVVDYVEPEDGGKPSTGDSIIVDAEGNAKDLKAEATISTRGTASINFTLARPEWAEGAKATITGDVYVNGAYEQAINSGTTIAVNATSTRITVGSDFETTDKLTLENVVVTYDKVKVQYVGADGKAFTDFAEGTTPSATLATNGGTIAFTVDGTVYTTTDQGDYTVSGVTETTGLTGKVTAGTAVSKSYTAAGTGYVTVKIENLKKSTDDATYVVKSSLPGLQALEFTVADAGTTTPAADAVWTSTVKATKNQVVFVRAADKDGLATLDNSDSKLSFVDNKTVAVGNITVASVASGIVKFTMIDKDLTLVGANVSAAELEKVFVLADGSAVHAKLKSAFTFVATETKTADLIKAEFVAAFINENKDEIGWTAKVNNKGVAGGGYDFANLVLTSNDTNITESKTIDDIDNVKVSHTAVWATYGEVTVVSDGTNNNVDDLCTLVGLTTETVSVKDKDGAMIYSGAANSGSSAAITDGAVIVTLDETKLEEATSQKAPGLPNAVPDDGTEITSTPEINNATNLDGALGQLPNGWSSLFPDTGAPGASIADYNALKGRKLTVMQVDLPVTANNYVRIKQTNEALALYPKDGNISNSTGKWVKDSGKVRSSDKVEYGIMIVEGSGPITIEVFISTDTNANNCPTTASYTVTIDPSKVSFAD